MDVVEHTQGETRGQVFLSYSRTDNLEFADQLAKGLETYGGYGVSIDRHSIVGGESWEQRTTQLIQFSDTVLFALSPESVKSHFCKWEIDVARQAGKRLLTVVNHAIDDDSVPDGLKHINRIYFYPDPKVPGSGFVSGLMALIEALSTDLPWIREHSKIAEDAQRWDSNGRETSDLYSGNRLARALAWRNARPANAPEITRQQNVFLDAGESAQRTRDNAARRLMLRIGAATAIGIVVFLGLLGATILSATRNMDSLALFHAELAQGALDGERYDSAMRWALGGLHQGSPENAQGARLAAMRLGESQRLMPLERTWKMTNLRDDIARATLSPDGRRVAVVSSRAIQILDARTLEPIASVATLGGEDNEDIEINFANDRTAFSPDGKRLLVVPGSRTLEPYIYDLATSKSLTLPYVDEFHDLAVGAEFSPDGKTFLIAHHNGWVELRDAASGRLIRSLGKRDNLASNVESFFTILHHATFSSGSDKVLLAYSGGWVEIWDATRGRRLQTAGRRPAETDQQQVWKFPLSFAVFSPDGKSIAMNGKDGGVTIWNATDGKAVSTYSKDVVIGAAAFSNDGKLLAAGGDNGIASVFNLEGSPMRAQLVGHAARITGVRFSNDRETVLTSSADGTIKNWSVDRAFDVAALPADSPQAYGVSSLEKRPVGPLRMTLSSEDGDFMDSTLTRDGVHVVTTERHQIKLWNTRRGSADRRWFFSPEQRIEVAADGNRLVVFGGQRAATVLDLSQAGLKTRATLAMPAGEIKAVRIPRHDETVVVLTDTGCLALLDAKTGRLLGRMDLPVDPRTRRLDAAAGALAVSDDGAYAAVETGGKGIAVYALKTGQIIKTLYARSEDAAQFLEFVDRKTILSVGGLGHYLTWKINDGSVNRYPLEAKESVDQAALSPDGRFLVTYSDQMVVKLRELGSGTVRWSTMAPETGVTQLRFSPDGRNIITGSKFFGVTIWDTETGLVRSEFSHDRFANVISPNYPGPAGMRNWDSFLESKVIAMWGAEGKTALTFSPGVVQEWDLRPLFDGSLQQRIARACNTLLTAGARAYRQNELARPVLRRRAPGDTDPCNDQGPSTWDWWTRW